MTTQCCQPSATRRQWSAPICLYVGRPLLENGFSSISRGTYAVSLGLVYFSTLVLDSDKLEHHDCMLSSRCCLSSTIHPNTSSRPQEGADQSPLEWGCKIWPARHCPGNLDLDQQPRLKTCCCRIDRSSGCPSGPAIHKETHLLTLWWKTPDFHLEPPQLLWKIWVQQDHSLRCLQANCSP